MLDQNLIRVGFLSVAVRVGHEGATCCPKPARKFLAKAAARAIIIGEEHETLYALQFFPIVEDKLESGILLRINVCIARNGRQNISMGVLVGWCAVRDRHG